MGKLNAVKSNLPKNKSTRKVVILAGLDFGGQANAELAALLNDLEAVEQGPKVLTSAGGDI